MVEGSPQGDNQENSKPARKPWSFSGEKSIFSRGAPDLEPARAGAQVLLPEYLLESVTRQLEGREHAQEIIDDFVTERVSGVKVNGVDVISIHIDHHEPELPAITQELIESPQTNMVVAEYFNPDLNGNRTLIGIENNMMDTLTRGREFSSRFTSAARIAEACAEAGKPVAVADITNKTHEYMATSELFRLIPAVTAYEGSFLIPPAAFQNIDILMALPPRLQEIAIASASVALWSGPMFAQRMSRKGMFNPEKITKFDRMVLDFEQARRLYLAKGIEQLTQEPTIQATDGENAAQMVVPYPEAHTLRMNDMLVNPNDKYNKLRSGVYKAAGALGRLDFAVRTYEHNGEMQGITPDPNGWTQISRQKITI